MARVVYPAGWRYLPLRSQADSTLVMEARDGSIVGYAILEEKNRHISDVAVLPEFRNRSVLLLESILDRLALHGGTWTADCRESTSYRLLKLADRGGRVKVLREEMTDEMNGEPRHRLWFLMEPRQGRADAGAFGGLSDGTTGG